MYGMSKASLGYLRGRLSMSDLVTITGKIVDPRDALNYKSTLDDILGQLKTQIKKLFLIFNRGVEFHISPNQ